MSSNPHRRKGSRKTLPSTNNSEAQLTSPPLIKITPLDSSSDNKHKPIKGMLLFLGKSHPWITVFLTISLSVIAYFSYQIQSDSIKYSSKFHSQNAATYRAQMEYEEIRDILINPASPVQSQIFAIRRIPEAMKARVDEVSFKKNNRTYPNAKPLKQLVLQYLRASREDNAGDIPHSKRGDLVTELFVLLHKLGPSDTVKPDYCLWNLENYPKNDSKNANWTKVRKRTGEFSNTLDLRHLDKQAFVGLEAPYLFQKFVGGKVFFPDGTNFGGGNLYGANLTGCRLFEATFSGCDLKSADLHGADLRGADFAGAQTEGAVFAETVK